MYEPVSAQNTTQIPGQHPTFASVPSWKDLIDSAVLQTPEEASNVPRQLVEPLAPGSDCAGQNVKELLENDLLADAVQQILANDLDAAAKDLNIVLSLNENCNDAKLLSKAVGQRRRAIKLGKFLQQVPRAIMSLLRTVSNVVRTLLL